MATRRRGRPPQAGATRLRHPGSKKGAAASPRQVDRGQLLHALRGKVVIVSLDH